jgi:uncharacterized protein (TIGR03118 family)
VQTNLVSDGAVSANVVDPALKNPWGISFGPASPFWVANNGSGVSTLYQGDGTKNALNVAVPPAPGSPLGTLGTPTGTVFNGTSANFLGDRFLFATRDGTISGWQPVLGTTAAVRALGSPGAAYTGLALAADTLYAADFANGRIEAWDSAYNSFLIPGAFVDPNLPSGYSPFNIQNLGGALYVTYAKISAGEAEGGPGFGFVDKFDADGSLLQRLVTGLPGDPASPLNAPWGLALAPSGFGDLSNLLLVGNFGDGRINGFDPLTGAFVGTLDDAGGTPIENESLWGLAFGNGGTGFDSQTLYFTAGLTDESHGLFGSLRPLSSAAVPEPSTLMSMSGGLIALFFVARRRRR